MLEEVRLSYQDQLIDCIMWVLVSHPDLHYYQASCGFLAFAFSFLKQFEFIAQNKFTLERTSKECIPLPGRHLELC